MSADDRLGELFERALDVPPAERDTFLEGACADPDLRAEVRSLLRSHDAAPEFLHGLGEQLLPAAFAARARAKAGHDASTGRRTAGRYTLLEELGRGGMGVVYKAYDPDLQRAVALKFLPAHLSADPEARARMRSEARAASALDHANIAVVHEIGSLRLDPADPPDGRLYIAMAYYDGETMDRKIARGPLPPATVLEYGAQIASGLSCAHAAGFVHRDVKPANLIVTERGELKILDFGIARAASGTLTRAGTPIGTVAYMSPEQTRGEVVDARADVWAVGAVLHEMLQAEPAFARASEEATIYAIRNDHPVRIVALSEDSRPGIQDLLDRCLAKEPSSRPADGGALLEEIERVRRGVVPATPARDVSPGDPRSSLVVLPFRNLSGDSQNEYFSDGLTEEVVADLAHVRSLRVISRTSSMRLKGSDRSVPAIARDLGVRYVLEGSVRKAGEALRITARLVDARADTQLWAGTFDGTVENVFAIQESVANAIVHALRLRLTPGERGAIADHPIPDPRAYESYLRARYEAWRFSTQGLERARRYIDAALEIVGDNELLYATLGQITALEVDTGGNYAGLERVEDYAERVFSLNPDSARGHWLRAWAAFNRGRIAEAIETGERALALQPDEVDTLLLLGYVYAHVGRNALASELLARALELDPLTPLVQGVQGFVPILEGRFADAVEPYRRQLAMDPESPFAAVFLGWALGYAGRTDEAVEALRSAATLFPGTPFSSLALSLSYGLVGLRDRALAAITPAFEAAAQQSEMFARELAHCYALAGERELALRWLEREVDLGMWNVPYLLAHDRFLDGIRDHPRFDAVIERARSLCETIAS